MAVHVLLVEDSEGDIRLMREAFLVSATPAILHVVTDGVDAMAFLKREGVYADAPRPDLVLLDLNLPRVDGREVLTRIKRDLVLKTIPTVILTRSEDEKDIVASYELHANCVLSKPGGWDEFTVLMRTLTDFWVTSARRFPTPVLEPPGPRQN